MITYTCIFEDRGVFIHIEMHIYTEYTPPDDVDDVAERLAEKLGINYLHKEEKA